MRIAGLLLLGLLMGCSDAEEAASPGSAAGVAAPAADAALVARGRSQYQSVCIACHNPDPTRDGAVGPALAGASLELLRAKVLRNEYPPGYTPKRDTLNMVPLPFMEKELPAVAAYLQSVGG